MTVGPAQRPANPQDNACELVNVALAKHGVGECPGRLLGSVALRYRPASGWSGWPAPPKPVGPPCRGRQAEEKFAGEGPLARPAKMARLEAILFLAREPLGTRKLAQLAGLADGTEARTLLRKLNRLYDTGRCAFVAAEVAGGFQLMSRAKFAPWLRRQHSTPVEVRLSAPAMETLAVVAYRQPVLRAQVEATRGVQCGEMLRQLMERELVRIVGRSEELGRPFLYGTTKSFLQVFGLRHLDELPRQEWFQAAAPADNQQEVNQQDDSSELEEESSVKTVVSPGSTSEDTMHEDDSAVVQQSDDQYEEYQDEYDDDDLEDDEEDDDELDEEELGDEELDEDEEDDDDEDEGFEQEDWQEVDEEDDEEEEEDEEEEDEEDWDDEEWEEEEED